MLLAGGAVALVRDRLAVDAISTGWPLANREVAFVRAAAAGIALAAALRIGVPCGAGRRDRGVVTAALAVSAVMAFAAFYNLGRPQFWNHAENRPEFVHTNDLRVYQPFAKYFKELGYDGVYMASVLAYAEDRRGGSLDSMGMQEVRSLGDHRVRRVHEHQGRDPAGPCARVFRRALGRVQERHELLRGCAGARNTFPPSPTTARTPPRCGSSSRRLLMAHAPASEGLLTATGLVDALLLLLMAVALWRSFGLLADVAGDDGVRRQRPLHVRHQLERRDVAARLAGVPRVRRGGAQAPALDAAGIFLALAALIRFFPVVALMGVALPALWAFGERWVRETKRPAISEPGWASTAPPCASS